MTLEELIAAHPQRASGGVPEWMLGFWKRYSISFADGQTDLHTHVCWLQSRSFSIDLRLPLETQQVAARPWAVRTPQELAVLANYEGWAAQSDWDGAALSWRPTEVSLQLHNRWPEPALLKRIGNCMIEFSPSEAYVEDWRLQPSGSGPLVGLHLIEERDLEHDRVLHRGGGLIVCGAHAALVRGRAENIAAPAQFRELVAAAVGDAARLAALFNFETSVARGTPAQGYSVMLSTCPARIGTSLFSIDGFEWLPEHGLVRQRWQEEGGGRRERLFSVDTLEPALCFDPATPFAAAARAWYEREAATLGRYTRVLV